MKHSILKTFLGSIILASSLQAIDFGALAKDVMKEVTKPTATEATTTSTSTLSNDTVTAGLKEALNKGVKIAIESLGKENGYLNNELVKIDLPNNLDSAATLVNKIGGEKYVNDLVKSMNDAASEAAPKTAEIFINAISKMDINNAQKILQGEDNAATNYFKESTNSDLQKLITPIVKEAMSNNQVATYYDAFNGYYQKNLKSSVDSSAVMGYAKSFGVDKFLPGSDDQSLDQYVTNKAIAGLFTMIEKEEKEIRENPVERTTDLLKKVFGS